MLKAMYRFILTDRHGHRTVFPWQNVHSFVQQFMKVLRVHMALTTDNNVRDLGNVARSIVVDSADSEMAVESPVGIVAYGPVVGSGTAAEAPTDYKLDTLITHGAGAGQLSYAATTVSPATIDASDIYVDIIREFTNNGAGIRVIEEIGLHAIIQTFEFLLIRDVLASPLVVPELATVELTYRILTSN